MSRKEILSILVVIPIFNEGSYVRNLSLPLSGKIYPRDGFEIIVVDNVYTDGSIAVSLS
jgi:glycosyltransferase involved in cell wall biosynthesis